MKVRQAVILSVSIAMIFVLLLFFLYVTVESPQNIITPLEPRTNASYPLSDDLFDIEFYQHPPTVTESKLPVNIRKLVDSTAKQQSIYSITKDYKTKVLSTPAINDYSKKLLSPSENTALFISEPDPLNKVSLLRCLTRTGDTKQYQTKLMNNQLSFVGEQLICMAYYGEFAVGTSHFNNPLNLYSIASLTRTTLDFNLTQLWLSGEQMFFTGAVYDNINERFVVTAVRKKNDDYQNGNIEILIFARNGNLIERHGTKLSHPINNTTMLPDKQTILMGTQSLISLNSYDENLGSNVKTIYDLANKKATIFCSDENGILSADSVNYIRLTQKTKPYLVNDSIVTIPDDPLGGPVYIYRYTNGTFKHNTTIQSDCFLEAGIPNVVFDSAFWDNDSIFMTATTLTQEPYQIIARESAGQLTPLGAFPVGNALLFIDKTEEAVILSNSSKYDVYRRDEQLKSYENLADWIWQKKFEIISDAGFPAFENVNDFSPDELVEAVSLLYSKKSEGRIPEDTSNIVVPIDGFLDTLRWFFGITNFNPDSSGYYNAEMHSMNLPIIPKKSGSLSLVEYSIAEDYRPLQLTSHSIQTDKDGKQNNVIEIFYFSLSGLNYALVKYEKIVQPVA